MNIFEETLTYSEADLNKIRTNFVQELRKAAKGTKNSIAFAKNPLPSKTYIRNGDFYQAMVIGGSTMKHATFKKTAKGTKLLGGTRKHDVPKLKNGKTLFEFFKKHLAPDITYVGLNFAYPMSPILRNNSLDGELMTGTKEHKFQGLVGKNIGEQIEKYILKSEGRKIHVNVANDTVCLVLSGVGKDTPQHIVGGIVGTGTNFGFFHDKRTIVNLESGNFNKFPQSDAGKAIDKKSSNPGWHIYEKELAGEYLYKHYNYLLKKYKCTSKPISGTYQLDAIAESSRKVESKIAAALLERSAALIATQIAAIYDFKKKKKLTFVMEGSIFWKGWHYRSNVRKYLRRFGLTSSHIRFVEVRESSLMGAAKLIV